MPHLAHAIAIANEFDSYMQDRAQRLGYRTRFLPPDEHYSPHATSNVALIEFSDAAGCQPPMAQRRMADYRNRGHFCAWTEQAGGLVQINGQTGVRTFAEEFFSETGRRSLPLREMAAYLDWLITSGASAALLTLAIQAPASRELVLVRFPSWRVAGQWLQRDA